MIRSRNRTRFVRWSSWRVSERPPTGVFQLYFTVAGGPTYFMLQVCCPAFPPTVLLHDGHIAPFAVALSRYRALPPSGAVAPMLSIVTVDLPALLSLVTG